MPRIVFSQLQEISSWLTRLSLLMIGVASSSMLLVAQDRPVSQTIPVKSSRDSISRSVSLSALTPNRVAADTGRMAWGRQDYSDYPTAVACDRAVYHMRAELMRTRTADTMPYSLDADTIPTLARAVAQACGARFTVDETPPHALWSLYRLALTVNDDSKAMAVMERQLSLATTRRDSAQRMEYGIEGLMNASPPRIAMARTLLQRIDALGTAAKYSQFRARLQMLGYWKHLYERDSLRAYATSAITVLQSMTPEERSELSTVIQPYEILLDLANEIQDLETQGQLLDQALAEIGTWRDGQAGSWITGQMALLETRRTLYGKRTKPLEGSFWFNTGGTPRPNLGKVSLLVRADHTCGTGCFSLYTLIRQLKAKYGDGLEITLITETRGFALGTGPISPAEEAKKASEYFLEFLKLPVGLLMDESPFTKRSDGRIIWQTSPIGAIFAGWNGANAVLIDPTLSVRWIGDVRSDRDRRFIVAAIDRVVNSQ
jgi:hypothetical protein